MFFFFFFFNDTATTEIYTLSLHDALPISRQTTGIRSRRSGRFRRARTFIARSPFHIMFGKAVKWSKLRARSEEHTSELQSPCNLVCRLLLEKKKKQEHPSNSTPSARPRTR